MFFYEIHEGDTDLFTDALLTHDLEFDEEEFLRLVLEARGHVLATFEEDSLVEAIANELQRRHGFVHVDDAHLTAAVNVSEREGETFLAAAGEAGDAAPYQRRDRGLETDGDEADEDDDTDDDEGDLEDEASGFRSLRVTLDRNPDLSDDDRPD